MPAANYFVSDANGHDTNAGTTWASAKKTIAAGLALVTGTAEIVAIAPGQYNEAITDPASAGASAAWNELCGDPWGIYTDGGANTHGETTENVIIYNRSTFPIRWTTNRNNYNYWRLRNLYCYGEASTGISVAPQPENLEILDCFGHSLQGSGIGISGGTTDTMVAKMYRCFGLGDDRGFSLRADRASFSTNPTVELYSCVGVSGGFTNSGSHVAGGIYLAGATAGTFTYIMAQNCSGFGYDMVSPYSVGIGSFILTYNKADLTRCFGMGYNGIQTLNAGGTITNCYGTALGGANLGTVTGVTSPAFIHSFPRLLRSSILNDALTDYSGSLSGEELYDIMGRLLEQTPGALEYIDAGGAQAPIGYEHDSNGNRGMQWTNDISASGGGAPIFGGNVFR
jgi:hypothetical protein